MVLLFGDGLRLAVHRYACCTHVSFFFRLFDLRFCFHPDRYCAHKDAALVCCEHYFLMGVAARITLPERRQMI